MLNISWANANKIGPVVQVLAQSPKCDKTAAYRAGRIFDAIRREQAKVAKAADEIWRKYCDKDEKLDCKRDPKGNYLFTNKENAEKCQAEVKAKFEETFISIKAHKLDFKAVQPELTGEEIIAIEEILDGVPDVA